MVHTRTMPIHALPQFEADLEADRKVYEALKPPRTIVVRFGALKMVGEFPYDGDAKPGCGSKLVVRTSRGTELGEMLTSTCPNAGCSKSVSRKEMLEYIENSGGRDYPFTTEGRVLRIASKEDLDEQARLEQSRHGLKMEARAISEELQLPMKIVDAEPILGGERITFYFNSEERVDFRELVRLLGAKLRARVDVRQVGARDEARITADYERCGQHCCCKTFLKVLKPVSMRSAKVQKATLDPLKISGRCGRLMCCLRYEDQTYEELRKRLPKRKTRVGTPEGDGWVIDSQILTQLVLVQLEAVDKQVAVPVEDLAAPGPPRPVAPPTSAPPPAPPGARPPRAPDTRRGNVGTPARAPDPRRPERPQRAEHAPSAPRNSSENVDEGPDDDHDVAPAKGTSAGPPDGASSPARPSLGPDGQPRRRRRRRRRRRPPGSDGGPPPPV
jgi:cell fate regulator YaaT (PSP1 superfamily)